MLLISGHVLPNSGPYNDIALSCNVPADFKSRPGLDFIHMQVRSLLPKLDLVCIWANNTSSDVIVISETWLNKTDS